jgi:CubicO group peptidase (beta-lactamase class C family)
MVMSTMQGANSEGLALAIIDQGRVTYVHTYGVKNAAREPPRTRKAVHRPAVK